jgi:DNA-binding CsgD family transcriptional regulator
VEEEQLDEGTRALRLAVDAARRGGAVLVRGAAPDALADLARSLAGGEVGLLVALGDEPVPEALAGLPVFEAAPSGGQARALRRRGLVELRCGVATTACELLGEAAALLAPRDPAFALRVLLEAAEAAAYAGDLGRLTAIGRTAEELDFAGAASADTLRIIAYLRGMGRMLDGDTAGAAPLLREAVIAGRRATDPVAVLQGGIAAAMLGADSAAHALHARAVERARADGDDALVAHALEFLVNADIFHGRYETAARHAVDGRALADEAGHLTVACQHTASLALVEALRGRPTASREHAIVALEHATGHGLGLPAAVASWALAVADLSEGRPREAADRIRALAAAGPGAGHPLVSLLAVPHLVEAAACCGDRRPAADALAAFERFARHAGQPWAEALVARCRGLSSTGEKADEHFRRAVVLHARAGRHFDRARTELLWGQALRLERRRADGHPHLRAALEAFERLDAGAWTERARAELRATGEAARSRREPEAANRLTPREREIVELVATGATNREIAAHLVLSPRTVDHHLRQVFAKLGISSRAELIRPG